MRKHARAVAAVAGIWASWAGAAAPAPTKSPEPEKIPPAVWLGRRAAVVHARLAVQTTLVLVPDEASYVEAIAHWTVGKAEGARRFPVLIDDGSYLAQQRIGRFVRGFCPSKVVRWKTGKALPKDASARETAIDAAAARAWGAEAVKDLPTRWASFGLKPAGVVVARPDDPAWTAALALSAGRGEPVVWVKTPKTDPNSYYTLQEADALQAQIEQGCKDAGCSYAGVGDDIDAVTLCMNAPVHVGMGGKDADMSLTDFIGRSSQGDRRERWAWAGEIFGDAGQAAYQAMCSLFLPGLKRAWLFDGYDSSEPWIAFDMTKAGETLSRVGITASVDDGPHGAGLDEWRRRCAGEAGKWMGVDARLIMVNTSGNAEFFDLKPGRGLADDVPILHEPAAVYFVHSWSATRPAERGTIGGMWLERGAFAYVGSVHEPYLQGFVPTPIFVNRLLVGFPWGAAPRVDNGPLWKIAVLGDPMWVMVGERGEPARLEGPIALDGIIDLDEEVGTLLKGGSFAAALRTLGLLGRDADAARLIAALAKDKPKELTPEAALAGVGSAYHAGDLAAFEHAASVLGPTLADQKRVSELKIGEVRDMVWQALWPVQSTLRGDEAKLLVECLRPESLVRDTQEAVRAVAGANQRGETVCGTPNEVVDRAMKLTQDRRELEEIGKLRP